MQLSKRLQAVADMVTFGSRVADIGCDHAYVSIYLIEHEISPHIIAMDVNQGPIDRAKDNIVKYGYENRIETRKSDGLEKLNAGEADTILIAGMGGALTVQILTDRLEVLQSVKELVLQPQSETEKVRHMLQEQNFLIIDESMIKEDGKYYVMMKAVHADRKAEPQADYILKKPEHFHYGRMLLEQKHPVLKEFLQWEYNLCEGIMQSLLQERTDHIRQRQKEIMDRMRLIQSGLLYYSIDFINQ